MLAAKGVTAVTHHGLIRTFVEVIDFVGAP